MVYCTQYQREKGTNMTATKGSIAQCPCGHWGESTEVGTPTTFRDRTFTVTSPDSGESHDVRFTWKDEDGRSVGTCQKTGMTNR